MTDQDDLSPEEASALRDLAAGPEPPASLENAAVERLRARGLIARRNRRGIPWLAAAAAAIALFAAGLYVGSRRPDAPAAAALPRYVLFLYDAPDEAALSPAEMGQRVEEYRNWARGVRERGAEIQGEKLGLETRLLGPGLGAPAGVLGGYFVVSAKDYETALAIARSCPHLKHGGTIEVRPIEET
jgi:hypothetical protein